MRIGELARRSGFSTDTLRWYDKIGLLRPSGRNPVSRFREYADEALALLALVKSAKLVGLDLSQIRKILSAARTGSACKTVIPLLDKKVREIDRAIGTLQELRTRLVRALKKGFPRKGAKGCSCPILEKLNDSTP